MSENKSTSNGIGFTGALLIAFIVLKLCNIIAWSWWWVLSPIWISVALAAIVIGLYAFANYREGRKHKKVVTKTGRLKSKWQERLDQMQEAQRLRNQKELDDKIKQSKSEEFRAQNKV